MIIHKICRIREENITKISYQKILGPKKQGGLFPQKEEPVVAVSSQETGQRNPHRPSK